MSDTPICTTCGEREAEFELRKISSRSAEESSRRIVCRPCLGPELADDTTSIVKISKSAIVEMPRDTTSD